jgi:glutamine amidotransferase
VFAHNGNLEDFSPECAGVYKPVGKTDSEKAFCLILEKLRSTFPQSKPALGEIYPGTGRNY